MNLDRSQLENILRINGLSLQSPRDQIDALLIKAGYTTEEITNALNGESALPPTYAQTQSAQIMQPQASSTSASAVSPKKKMNVFLKILITIVVVIVVLPLVGILLAVLLAGLNNARTKGAGTLPSSATAPTSTAMSAGNSATSSDSGMTNSSGTSTFVPGMPTILKYSVPSGWWKSEVALDSTGGNQEFYTTEKIDYSYAAQGRLAISPTNGMSLSNLEQAESQDSDNLHAQYITVSGIKALRISYDRKVINEVVHDEGLYFTANGYDYDLDGSYVVGIGDAYASQLKSIVDSATF